MTRITKKQLSSFSKRSILQIKIITRRKCNRKGEEIFQRFFNRESGDRFKRNIPSGGGKKKK